MDCEPHVSRPCGNCNRKSGCHQSGSVESTVFFRSYAPDFQTLCISNDSEGEEVDLASEKKSRQKKSTKECNFQEARYLSLFVSGQRCHWKVWDEFFGNANKHVYRYFAPFGPAGT
jgi:hypothetical protein